MNREDLSLEELIALEEKEKAERVVEPHSPVISREDLLESLRDPDGQGDDSALYDYDE